LAGSYVCLADFVVELISLSMIKDCVIKGGKEEVDPGMEDKTPSVDPKCTFGLHKNQGNDTVCPASCG